MGKEKSQSEQTKSNEGPIEKEKGIQISQENFRITWTREENLLISLFQRISENENNIRQIGVVPIFIVKGCRKMLQKF